MFFPKVFFALVLAFVAQSYAYVYNLDVYYGDRWDQQPGNSVGELGGQSNDINFQFGGKYVWLVPAYSDSPSVTGFDLIITRNSIPGHSDLAKGAGGDFRYLVPTFTPGETPVTQVALYRPGSAVGSPPNGWRGITANINGGRGKTFLYLVWA